MKIRNYQSKDKENVQNICVVTANPIPEKEKTINSILAVYCDYFLDNEAENCFVAVNEKDEAVGYILCAANYKKFRSTSFRYVLKRIKSSGFSAFVMAVGEIIGQRTQNKEYPAFLHINISPDYQRLGIGHKLVNALIEHLKEKGSIGLKLIVGGSNEVGKAFYKKYGFKEIRDYRTGVVMGVKFKG